MAKQELEIKNVICTHRKRDEIARRYGYGTAKTRREYMKDVTLTVGLANQEDDLFERLGFERELVLPIMKKFAVKYLEQRGLELNIDYTIKWNDKANCSCGCSPAFSIKFKNTTAETFMARQDFHIEIG